MQVLAEHGRRRGSVQYDRLAATDVDAAGEHLVVRLQPRPGQQLDAEALRACLDYTLTESSGR
jgi:hypothetical protein